MGWAYVTCGERVEELHDMRIWTIRHFCIDAAQALAAEEPSPALCSEARDFFTAWDWPGPGVVTGTCLDTFVQDNPQRARVLARVFDRASATLRNFGGLIPLAYLEAHVNGDSPGGVYSKPQPTELILRDLSKIAGLLE